MYPAPNLYRYQGSLLWGDFARIIRSAALPNTQIKLIGPALHPNDIISIFDYHMPRRKGLASTAHGLWVDESRDSQVCNAAWLGGHIPMWGWQGQLGDPDKGMGEVLVKRPAAGARWVLEQLVENDVIDRNNLDVAQIVSLMRDRES